MASEWPTLSLQEANIKLIDCEHRTPPSSDTGYPYVAIPQLRGGRIDLSAARRISSEHYIEWTRKAKPTEHDVVLSRRCNPGETAFVPADLDFALGQNLVLLRADGTKVYPPFLRWLVSGPEWWEQIGKFLNVGAVFDSLRCADVPKFTLHIPPLEEQRTISQILGSLDSKIALSWEMNETLEAMARTLFKSWFVDFDPVRAKAEGRPTGLPAHIAALFPNSFEESELGEGPLGWLPGKLGDLLTVDKGLSYKGEHLGSGIPMVNLGCFLGRGRFNDAAVKLYSGDYKPRHTVRVGDLVVANTDITQKREVIGSPAVVPPWLGNDALIFTHHVFALRLNSSSVRYKLFAYFLLLQEEFRERAMGFATGTTVLALPKDAILDLAYLSPPSGPVEAFDRIATPLLEMQWRNEEESRSLATMRDTLLPKLISGEIRLGQKEERA